MNFGIPKAVEAIGNAVKSVFDFASTVKEEQSETEVIRDKRDSETACKYAEFAIRAVERSAVFIKKIDKFRFNYFAKKFRDYK
ncbi:hypothetical protein DBY21_02955 [Candidatus Gastranaerophilales bacterium]|nr:MAG: hypothetical protein DBY21_02955 [Candidatus Gastranaerophilales bacterium]